MKRLFSQLHRPLRNERGEITFFACFFVVGVVMLISFLLLYASVRITCINIRNGAKMELNNLSATIYADTYRSQRETNFEEYLRTLYSSRDYTEMLEATVAGGLAEKVPLSTDDYTVSDISLEFNVVGDRVEYIFYSHPGRRQPGGLGQMAHALHSTVGNHHGFRQRGLYRTRYLCCGDRGLERTYPSRSDSNGYQPQLHRVLTPQ